MAGLIAIVDCNNFYASCERLFNPKLNGKPVVVLSNNDGFCNRTFTVKRVMRSTDVGGLTAHQFYQREHWSYCST